MTVVESDITLGSVTLPGDMFWDDENKWSSISQTVEVTHGGQLVIDEADQSYGKPITLKAGFDSSSWVTRANVNDLITLSLTLGTKHLLTLADGRTYTVMFKRDNNPIDAEPVLKKGSYVDGDFYNLTLRLMEVEP